MRHRRRCLIPAASITIWCARPATSAARWQVPSHVSVRRCWSTVWRQIRTPSVIDPARKKRMEVRLSSLVRLESLTFFLARVILTAIRRAGVRFASPALAGCGSTDHHASGLAFGTGLFDHDWAVEEGTDGGRVGAEVVCGLADGVYGAALGERQGEKNLIGRVGVDGPLVHSLEGEQLVHGLVRDVLGGLAALAQADECRGNGALVFGNQAEGSPLPRAGPANRLDLDISGQPLFSQPLHCTVAKSPGDVVAKIGDAGDAEDSPQWPATGLDPGPGHGRLDPGLEPAASSWVETRGRHCQGDGQPQGGKIGSPGVLEERISRCLGVEGASLEDDAHSRFGPHGKGQV